MHNVVSDELREEISIHPFMVASIVVLIVLGPTADFVGISAVIWHLSHVACLIFASTVLLVVAICYMYYMKVSDILEKGRGFVK